MLRVLGSVSLWVLQDAGGKANFFYGGETRGIERGGKLWGSWFIV